MNVNGQLISRRDLLLLGGAAAAGTMLQPIAADAYEDGSFHSRTRVDLNRDWRFIRSDIQNASQPIYNDADWQAIHLPHTFNGIDGEQHGNYYRGPSWYRRRLHIQVAAGKRFYLQFAGAATVAAVYVNGQLIGTHRGNFAAFCFDISSALNPDGVTTIAVRVDNSFNKDIPPLAGDFNIFGGLYRSVHLLILNDVSISPLDYGSSGVYILQEKVSQQEARLRLTAILRNTTSEVALLNITWQALDANGHPIATAHHSANLGAGTSAEAQAIMRIVNPHLWNGIADPYLYTMRVIVEHKGEVVDRLEQPLGLRFFHIDPETGFYLNGRSYPLRGVCTHDDRPGVGRAVTAANYDEDCAMIKDLGANVVRLAHYQHDQVMYSAFDRSGILVWTEDGLVNHLEDENGFNDNARQQIIELVKQNYNHPSVIVWSLYNELSFRTASPSQLNLEFPQTPVLTSQYRFGDLPARKLHLAWNLLFELNQLVHNLDPSRLTVAATDQNAEHPINYITDVIAFNRYEGWYGGTPGSWPGTLDGLKRDVQARMPGRCIGLSEYGAGANPFQHQLPVKQPSPGGQFHPEEWQCVVHEAAWQAIAVRPWLWLTTLWVMFDFSSAGRNEGANPGRNDKGLITYDRKIKKDAYFFYKAQWTTEPFVHLCDRRFANRSVGKWPVKAYTNCPKAELFVNGKSQGVQMASGGIVVWERLEFDSDTTRLEAVATDVHNRRHSDGYTIRVEAG